MCDTVKCCDLWWSRVPTSIPTFSCLGSKFLSFQAFFPPLTPCFLAVGTKKIVPTKFFLSLCGRHFINFIALALTRLSSLFYNRYHRHSAFQLSLTFRVSCGQKTMFLDDTGASPAASGALVRGAPQVSGVHEPMRYRPLRRARAGSGSLRGHPRRLYVGRYPARS